MPRQYNEFIDEAAVFLDGKEECARDCARRRVSERSRREAVALGA